MELVNQFFNQYVNEIILIALFLAFISAIVTVINSGRIKKINRKYQIMMRGMEDKDLESMLMSHLDALSKTDTKLREHRRNLATISKQLEISIQGVAMVRYNPFDHMGGDQSFSIAFLDGHGDGLVLTSLYSRDGSTVFAKPVVDRQSKYPLSNEEQEAIKTASGIANV